MVFAETTQQPEQLLYKKGLFKRSSSNLEAKSTAFSYSMFQSVFKAE